MAAWMSWICMRRTYVIHIMQSTWIVYCWQYYVTGGRERALWLRTMADIFVFIFIWLTHGCNCSVGTWLIVKITSTYRHPFQTKATQLFEEKNWCLSYLISSKSKVSLTLFIQPSYSIRTYVSRHPNFPRFFFSIDLTTAVESIVYNNLFANSKL